MAHCERCRGLHEPAEPSPERNLALEEFIERWAQEHGMTVKWPEDREGKRTIVRIT